MVPAPSIFLCCYSVRRKVDGFCNDAAGATVEYVALCKVGASWAVGSGKAAVGFAL